MAEDEEKPTKKPAAKRPAPKKKAATAKPELKEVPPTDSKSDEAPKAAEEPAAEKTHRKTVAKEDRKFVSASTGEAVDDPKQGHAAHTEGADLDAVHAERKGNATPFRIASAALWVLGIVAEVLAVVFLKKNKSTPWVITPLVIDFVLVVVGSQLWKHANHIDPPAKSEGFMYWLKTELGLVVAVIAFAPIVVILLLDKKADKKVKGIATIVAVVALVLAGVSGVDYHPATQEGLDAATQQAALLSDGGVAYWTEGGSVYHFNPDCQALTHSAEIKQGTIEQAFDAGKTRGCKFCTEAEGDDVLDEKKSDADVIADAKANQENSALEIADESTSTELDNAA